MSSNDTRSPEGHSTAWLPGISELISGLAEEWRPSWDEYRANLEKIARDNLRVARWGEEWTVISLTTFWRETSETPAIMDSGFTSERAAQLRLESYVVNYCDTDSRNNRADPCPYDRGSYVEPEHFNAEADAEFEKDRQLSILRRAGVAYPDAVLATLLHDADLRGADIPF